MPKTKKPRTYSDEEAKADEVKDRIVPVSREGVKAGVNALTVILDTMRSLPLARLYERMFDSMGKARRMSLCKQVGVSYSFDPAICVKRLVNAMDKGPARDKMMHDPWCWGFLVEAFESHPALQNLNPAG